jgi:hypothetical protein
MRTTHATKLVLAAPTLRNRVIRALVGRISSGAGRHSPVRSKRVKARDDADLAQRVRDVGEW